SEITTFANLMVKINEIETLLKKLSPLIFKRPKKIKDIKFGEDGPSVINELFRLIKEIPKINDNDNNLSTKKSSEFLEKFKFLIDRIYERLAISPDAIEFISQISTYSEEKKEELRRILSKKSPSPSRLRRVWQELLHFSESSEDFLNNFFESQKLVRKKLVIRIDEELDKKEYTLGDAKINGIDIGCIIYNGDKTIVTANYLDSKFKGKEIDNYENNDLKNLLKTCSLEIEWYDGDKNIVTIDEIINVEEYIPVVFIYKTAGEFMFLCPGKYTIELANIIKNNFFKRFNKVLGKLNLNIGAIYFKYKQPLYIMLDAGKRLINEFESKELQQEKKYKIKKEDEKVVIEDLGWVIIPKLGDGREDRYYSTFKDSSSDEYIPALDINDEGEVKIFLNLFDYEYLESSQMRFNLILDKNTMKREHHIAGKYGPRPYLLEDLEEIVELWAIIDQDNGKLTSSQIKKLEYVCASKIEEWKLKDKNPAESDLYIKFVKSSVENICKDKLKPQEKKILVQSILSGMFFDVVELFMKIEVKSLSPFDVISSILGDFQYTKEDRKRAEKWILDQIKGEWSANS
ncbi:MAG: hypothetical protein ACE5KE_10895, partial [Methanosarcinales archaeon]